MASLAPSESQQVCSKRSSISLDSLPALQLAETALKRTALERWRSRERFSFFRSVGSAVLHALSIILWPVFASLFGIGVGVSTIFVVYSVLRILIDLFLYGIVRLVTAFSQRFLSDGALADALTYEQWTERAAVVDINNGNDKWRSDQSPSTCKEYSHQELKHHFQLLRTAMRQRDCKQITFCLTAALNRHHCGLDNPELHRHALLGTKHIVEAYLQEIEKALVYFTTHDCAEHSYQEKLQFLRRCENALGTTALCLSGGGALALSHAGVLKALISVGLLPRVVSGTSGGALCAGVLATHTDEEILETTEPNIVTRHDPLLEPLYIQIRRFLNEGVLADYVKFSFAVRQYIGDYTFEEAFEKTKRVVCVSVTKSSGSHTHTVLLNYLNAPHVYIWSAVVASCALPGLLPPVTLLAKNKFGEPVEAFPSGTCWMDGSITADVPMTTLRRLFQANQFIVAQANPHITPFVKKFQKVKVPGFLARAEALLSKNLRHRVTRLVRMKLLPRFLGRDVSGVFLQKYSGLTDDTVTIVPQFSAFDMFKLLKQPTEDEMRNYLEEGIKATWPCVPLMHHRLRVELRIQKCLDQLQLIEPES